MRYQKHAVQARSAIFQTVSEGPFSELRADGVLIPFRFVDGIMGACQRHTLEPYWEEPALLKRLTGYSWWVEAVEEL